MYREMKLVDSCRVVVVCYPSIATFATLLGFKPFLLVGLSGD